MVALACIQVLAQAERARIRGSVVDPAGASLAKVTVRVINERTRESRHVTTDHEGHFTIAELGVGVEVAAPGDDMGFDARRGLADAGVEGERGVGCVHGVILRRL